MVQLLSDAISISSIEVCFYYLQNIKLL